MPFVVTELSTQGSLLLKQPGTPLIFPAPGERTPCHRAGLPLLPPLGPMPDVGCRVQDKECGMQDMGCRKRDMGCGMQDVGCRMLSCAWCSERRGEAAHPKTWLLLTRSIVDRLNHKPECILRPQSWSWPSCTKYVRQKHVGTGGELFAWHPPEGARCLALPLQPPPNLQGPHRFQMEPHSCQGSPARSEGLATAAAC